MFFSCCSLAWFICATCELGLLPCLRLPPLFPPLHYLPHHPPAPNPPLSTLPISITESLINYDIVSDADDVEKLIPHMLSDYIDAGTKDTCEICERVGVVTTHHHLILVCFASRPMGGKNRKRGC